MPILCIHNPAIHSNPQSCYKVEVKFKSLHTCPQEALIQVVTALPRMVVPRMLNQVPTWQQYRPSRVGPVLRLPAAKGNRKVTVLVWLESPNPVAIPASPSTLEPVPFPGTETVIQGQQIFNHPEWVKHVGIGRDASGANASWCGAKEKPFFEDASHAALNGRAGGRLVACPECVKEIYKALCNGN